MTLTLAYPVFAHLRKPLRRIRVSDARMLKDLFALETNNRCLPIGDYYSGSANAK